MTQAFAFNTMLELEYSEVFSVAFPEFEECPRIEELAKGNNHVLRIFEGVDAI